MGLLDDEIRQWKRSFGLLSTLDPAKDKGVRGLLGVPSKLDDTLYSKSDLYRGAKDAITAPIRAWRGELDPYSPEGVQEALNTAGYAMLGGMPGGARGPGSVGMVHRPKNHLGQEIPPTRYELAHQIAQRNAALPVEQGGLGLPENNTAMDRARAMGAENEIPIDSLRRSYYMGTKGIDSLTGEELKRVSNFGQMNRLAFESGIRGDDFPTMETGYRYGKAPQSGVSKNYADHIYEPGVSMAAVGNDDSWTRTIDAMFMGDRDIHEYQGLYNPNIRGSDGEPLLSGVNEINIDKPTVGEENAISLIYSLPERGYYPNPDNAKMRSRFAAFDPARRDSADLLAGIAPWAIAAPLGYGLLGRDDDN